MYTVKVLVTDNYMKRGGRDFEFVSDLKLNDLRAFVYHEFFRNASLRAKIYTVTLMKDGKRKGDCFMGRIGPHAEGELVYMFTGPRYNLGSPVYIVDKKTGKLIGTEGSEDMYVTVRSALGTNMKIRTGANFYIKRFKD